MTLKYIPLDSATSVTSTQPEYKDLSFGIFTQKVTVTCSFIEEKKKGGRPKKLKQGRKNFKSMEETGQTEKTLQHIQDTAHTVTRKVEELEMESPLTCRRRGPEISIYPGNQRRPQMPNLQGYPP